MFNSEPPRIYVSKVPTGETSYMPSDAIELTLGTDGYIVNNDIEGLSRPDADIARSKLAGANASRMSGSNISERNIVFDIIPMPNIDVYRERLYYILPYDEMLRFYFVKGGKRVFIDGKVEKISGAFKPGKPFSFAVSILCPFPWFQSVQRHRLKLTVGDNEISYDGDIPAGFTLDVPFRLTSIPPGMPGNPTGVPLIKIENGYVTDLSVTIGGKAFAYSGQVRLPFICTIPGQKKFTGRLYKEADENEELTIVPAFSAMTMTSQWPTIDRSSKTVTVSCSDDGFSEKWFNRQNVFTYRDTYSGV